MPFWSPASGRFVGDVGDVSVRSGDVCSIQKYTTGRSLANAQSLVLLHLYLKCLNGIQGLGAFARCLPRCTARPDHVMLYAAMSACASHPVGCHEANAKNYEAVADLLAVGTHLLGDFCTGCLDRRL